MAIQSLYRRYRPGRFSELRGQEHLKLALQNAIREGTVSHAYLFSGPRGTGKTTTARILAKALNCESVVDGEPCGECESCRAIDAGSSMDVIELDAASNRGIDAMRDLVARAALGSPGRTKLYILDEAHMLTKEASNTLLKTLEEPPAHVVFVLATTEPEKVLPTIRSRTQHYELRLLDGQTLQAHLRWVADDAKLDVDDDGIALAVRRGKGSARDALSALDQIVAAGGAGEDDTVIDEIVESLCERDTGRALVAVAQAAAAGREPRQLAEVLLAHLRDALVAMVAPEVLLLADDAREIVADQGRRLGNASIVRGMDALGEAIQQMRESPDPRVALEVALVRCTRPELDTSPAALVERLERLERAARTAPATAVPATGAPSAGAPATTAPATGAPATASASATGAPSTGAPAGAPAARRTPADRPTLGALRPRSERPAPSAAPAGAGPESGPASGPAAAAPTPPTAGALPTRDELTKVWADVVMPTLKATVKGKFASGRFLSVDGAVAVYALPTPALVKLAENVRGDVEAALAVHVGRPVPITLVVDPAGGPAESPDDQVDLDALTDAPVDSRTGIDHLSAAFPGSEVVEDQ